MGRSIPAWIGKVDVPQTRQTTIQLLTCLAKLIGEYDNIVSMFNEISKPLPTHVFVAETKEMALHLASTMDDQKLKRKRTDFVWVGKATSDIGHLNVKLASLLHQYFDEPDFKIKTKHPPKTQDEIDEAVRKERNDESPCPEVPCKEEVKQTA